MSWYILHVISQNAKVCLLICTTFEDLCVLNKVDVCLTFYC